MDEEVKAPIEVPGREDSSTTLSKEDHSLHLQTKLRGSLPFGMNYLHLLRKGSAPLDIVKIQEEAAKTQQEEEGKLEEEHKKQEVKVNKSVDRPAPSPPPRLRIPLRKITEIEEGPESPIPGKTTWKGLKQTQTIQEQIDQPSPPEYSDQASIVNPPRRKSNKWVDAKVISQVMSTIGQRAQ